MSRYVGQPSFCIDCRCSS